jgi:hypothetical protein
MCVDGGQVPTDSSAPIDVYFAAHEWTLVAAHEWTHPRLQRWVRPTSPQAPQRKNLDVISLRGAVTVARDTLLSGRLMFRHVLFTSPSR